MVHAVFVHTPYSLCSPASSAVVNAGMEPFVPQFVPPPCRRTFSCMLPQTVLPSFLVHAVYTLTLSPGTHVHTIRTHFLLRRNPLLGRKVLFPNRTHQYFEGFHLAFGQETKFRAEKHEMLKARIQVRRHFQSLEGSKKGTVNNPIDTKEASKDLSAKGGKLGCLKDPQGLLFVILVGEFGFVIDLVGNPGQDLVNVYRSRDTDGVGRCTVRPTVFDPGRKAFASLEGVQVRIRRHDCPNRAHVIVEINRVHGDPCGT